MGADSSIEWCDHTFNPWEGCEKCAQGCKFCYAEVISNRWSGRGVTYWGGDNTARRFFGDNHWRQPLRYLLGQLV